MWYYKNGLMEDISQFPPNAYGFIYKITALDTLKFYIGRKNLYFERNLKLGKKELAALAEQKKPGKKKITKKQVKESDWKSYYGSEPALKADVNEVGEFAFEREILQICYTKKQLTFYELKYQLIEGVLETENSYNGNILGKFFRKDLIV